MDKPFPEAVQEYVVLRALYIGKLVAGVLIATNRIQKAIEFYKEFMVLLGYRAVSYTHLTLPTIYSV